MLRPSPTAAVLLGLMAALAAGASSAAPSTTAPMGFGDARVLLHERADIMAADRAEIARAESEAEAAKSLSGPKVEMDVKQVWGTKTVDLGIDTGLGQLSGLGGPIGGVPGQIISSLAQKYNHVDIHFKEDIGGPRAAVTATLPIYTGGLITAQQNALNHKVSETRADRDMRENTLDAELAARYWGVQLARSVAALHRSVLEDQNEELRRAKRFEQKGLIAKVERLAVEVARDNAKRTLVSAESDVDVAEAELMRQLRATSLPELSSPLFVLTGDLGTLDQWQNRADTQSPAIRKMNALRAQAGEGISAAEASFKPKVYAFGTKNLIKHYLTLPEPDWMAGVGVTFTLWDNHDRFDKLNAARSVVTKAEAARSEAKNRVATAVEVAFLRVMQAREEFELTGSTVELARENLRLREASFAEGLSNAVDVDTARTKLTGAEVARRAAAYKFVVSWAMLHASAGAMPDFVNSLTRSDLVVVKLLRTTLFHRLEQNDRTDSSSADSGAGTQAPRLLRPASRGRRLLRRHRGFSRMGCLGGHSSRARAPAGHGRRPHDLRLRQGAGTPCRTQGPRGRRAQGGRHRRRDRHS